MLSAIPAHIAEEIMGRVSESVVSCHRMDCWKKVGGVRQSVITVHVACHSSFLTDFNGSLLFYHVSGLNCKWLTAMVPILCSALHGTSPITNFNFTEVSSKQYSVMKRNRKLL
jgi:hypothetical protein